MLTHTDLQQITGIVQSETRKIVQEETRKIVKDELKQGLKPVQKDISKIKDDMRTIANGLDHDILRLRRRMDRIETHVHLAPLADF